LTVLLRLAVRIHRGRDLDSPEVLLQIDASSLDHQLKLVFEEGWLEQHPLTAMDLDIEAKRLEAAGFYLTIQ
jgi:exopolyphosphatase/guanosine-5'-triphosphate,3'-diphosphate pyrophosphatase